MTAVLSVWCDLDAAPTSCNTYLLTPAFAPQQPVSLDRKSSGKSELQYITPDSMSCTACERQGLAHTRPHPHVRTLMCRIQGMNCKAKTDKPGQGPEQASGKSEPWPFRSSRADIEQHRSCKSKATHVVTVVCTGSTPFSREVLAQKRSHELICKRSHILVKVLNSLVQKSGLQDEAVSRYGFRALIHSDSGLWR